MSLSNAKAATQGIAKVATSSATGSAARILRGNVTKVGKMDKTATVCVDRQVEHNLTNKLLTRTTKLLVHDPTNAMQLGNSVIVKACRPLSKRKHYTLDSILDPFKHQQLPKPHQLRIPIPTKKWS
ncbi:30S ribosomal protein S17 [Wallemia ichthyophaga EXF-994]|uniref:30S ribosomal protein S17 n=1 Tax=Wallemia ichthyophaga (strain EXF-994 / CBS 113033) TaxID=1299270 RepID=R9AA08_WALI9|nr:30S ribosomal protein S17 [Wallemia ichthyophaga EXF-994]EOQ99016.1 30S ribosomal protein S17 [Wallemia ichthyophaga EXF-994]TIB01357.1 hypothetical protein E3P96_02385 [Wallemia ichthyophaga]